MVADHATVKGSRMPIDEPYPNNASLRLLNRVPEITILFWIIKVMATTVGETAADFLNTTFNFGLNGTSIVMSGLLILGLWAQFRMRRYVPSVYWLVVVLVSVVGTLIWRTVGAVSDGATPLAVRIASMPSAVRTLLARQSCTALAPSVIEPPPTVTMRSALAARASPAAAMTASRGVCGGIASKKGSHAGGHC